MLTLKTIFIILAVLSLIFIGFCVWACFYVGAKSEKEQEKFFEKRDWE